MIQDKEVSPTVQMMKKALKAEHPEAITTSEPVGVAESVTDVGVDTKAKKKKAAKSTGATEQGIKFATPSTDFETVVHDIENMDKTSVLSTLDYLDEQSSLNYFQVGGLLSRVLVNKWYESDDNPEMTFQKFVFEKYDIKYRKAMYMIDIYNSTIAAEVPWKEFSTVGWSRMKEIAGVISKDNWSEWVERAKVMTIQQLNQYINSLKAGQTKDVAEKIASGTTTLSFKVHSDQKETIDTALEESMKESKTDVKTVALEYICLNYLQDKLGKKTKGGKAGVPNTGGKPVEMDDPKTVLMNAMKQIDNAETVLMIFSDIYPNVNVTVEL